MIALYILGGLLLLILIVAALVGTAWKFERSVFIDAPVSKVWEYTHSLHGINQWNPWLDRDPNLKQEYKGTDGTVGASYSWDSPEKNVGAGHQTITGITPTSEMTSQVQFIRPFASLANAWIRIQPHGQQTKASWGIAGSTPYPMNIIKLTGIMEKNLDRDFMKGLGKLKDLSEK